MADAAWRQSSGPVREVLGNLLNALADVVHVRRAAALLVDGDHGTCRAVAARGLTDTQLEYLIRWLTGSAAGRVYRERLVAQAAPVYIGPVARKHAQATRRRDDRVPHLAVPLIGTDGVLLGVLGLEMGPPHQRDLAIAAAMGRAAAIAVEQAAAADAQAAEDARNTAILDIVREVDRRLDLPDVLAAICRKTVEAFGCRQATIFFRSRRHRAALPLADYGTPSHVAERFVNTRYAPGDNIPHEKEIEAGQTVVIDRDRHPLPADIALLDAAEAHGFVLIPLRADDGAIRGVLEIGVAEPRVFTPEDLRALQVVAHHAAMAIMRARFLHATEERARFRAALSALAVELNTTTSRTQSLRVLCGGAALFGVSVGMLLVQAGRWLVPAATYGEVVGDDWPRAALDDPENQIGRAYLSGDVVLDNDRRSVSAPPGLRSLLTIPLAGTAGQGGVLVFGDPRPRRFRPVVTEEAGVLGALAGAALRSVDLLGRLHESNDRLRRVSMLKDQFLANVSHDLRTPLNVIIGYAQLALEDAFGAPNDELRTILERMLASAGQQLTLVQDLLDLSRLELNGLTVKPTAVALGPVFEEMEFLATNLVREKPIRVVVDPAGSDVWVEADPNRLRQILTNLLSNAAKFTDEGMIGLRAVAASDTVCIEVSDTGIGVPADQYETIFEPFRQVEGERAALGTGLGLAIARRLTELMNGVIQLESTPGRGSVFRVSLAAMRPPAGAEQHPAAAAM